MVMACRQEGPLVTRNMSMFHRLPHEVAEDHPVTEDETEMAVPTEPPSPGRDRKRPKYQEDQHVQENLHSICWNKYEVTRCDYGTVFQV